MLPGRIEAVTTADVQSRAIEYKRDLPGNSDSERKEFLADVSSLANAGGGNILFGVEAKGGIPVALHPIETDDPESVNARMENIAADGIDPRISGVTPKYLPCDGGYIFIIHVPQSWSGPHMHDFEAPTIDRQRLLVPEVIIENPDEIPEKALRPAFDAIWNAGGWPKSMNYDENGEWRQWD